MHPIKDNRVVSIDLLKGLVMVVMALDHTRDYFHASSFYFDPADPEKTHLALFFTRWITHYCAPIFSFLAGMSAYLVGRRKSKNELSVFLLKRGAWLIFIEFVVVNFAWRFDIHYPRFSFNVIWSLGISMIILAALIRLKLNYILVFSLLMIFGHNLLDNISADGLLWSIIHQRGSFDLLNGRNINVVYPIVPWVGVMSLGYYFGQYYKKDADPARRQKLFSRVGMAGIVLFFIIRWVNQYGDPQHWQAYESVMPTLYSFMNPSKYPPSLVYLLMTLGPAFLFLATTEKLKGKWVDFFVVFGRVPFFYYIVHLYVIHFFAMVLAQFTGFGWRSMILKGFVSTEPQLKGFGVNLWVVYIIWILIILLLYPLCKKFSDYKLAHKEKTWLSYL